MNTREPATLHGKAVRLEPLDSAHFDDLCGGAFDASLWRWFPMSIRSREELTDWLNDALAQQRAGAAIPFAIVEVKSGAAIGSSRFANLAPEHRRLEIGWTWIAVPWQRTAVNTETKYLMLQYAFESLDCIRVEFKTDSLNERSRAALLRIGAREEGTLRQHIVTNTGRIRDSVYFSVIRSEWPGVKAALETRLSHPPLGL